MKTLCLNCFVFVLILIILSGCNLVDKTSVSSNFFTKINNSLSSSTYERRRDEAGYEIILEYSNNQNLPATQCTVSDLENIFSPDSPSCNCTNGVCQAFVKATSNYYVGEARFNYTVTVNGVETPKVSVTLNILPGDFVSEWRTTSPGDTITLPVVNSYYDSHGFGGTITADSYDIYIDWGDGSATRAVLGEAAPVHPYASAGLYTITITGDIKNAWHFDGVSGSTQLINVFDLGDIGWTDLFQAFRQCSALESFAGGDTSDVINMRYMLAGTTILTSINVSSFDTSQVTDMSHMFHFSQAVSSLDVSSFITTNVTSFSHMFYGTFALSSIDVSSFLTDSVTNVDFFSSMFTVNNGNPKTIYANSINVDLKNGQFGTSWNLTEDFSSTTAFVVNDTVYCDLGTLFNATCD